MTTDMQSADQEDLADNLGWTTTSPEELQRLQLCWRRTPTLRIRLTGPWLLSGAHPAPSPHSTAWHFSLLSPPSAQLHRTLHALRPSSTVLPDACCKLWRLSLLGPNLAQSGTKILGIVQKLSPGSSTMHSKPISIFTSANTVILK